MRHSMALPIAFLCIFTPGCGDSIHLAPYVPKHRDYALPAAIPRSDVSESTGSLWRNGLSASMLYTDARALHENDLVVVKIEEVADAQRSADTDLSRNSQLSAQISAFLKQVTTSTGGPGVNANLSNAFDGKGTTARTERLTATVPAIVRKALPNGNLFIEGHRVILVNAEEHHFYISGVIRPIDIDQENSVKSSMIADAEIEFTGRGVLTDNQHQGFLGRLLGAFSPF
jgi:flagellar L-ring protein FlgH